MFFNKKKKEESKINVSYDTYIPIEEPTGIPIGNISNNETKIEKEEEIEIKQPEIIFDDSVNETKSLNEIIGINNVVNNDINFNANENIVIESISDESMPMLEKQTNLVDEDILDSNNINSNKKFFDNNMTEFKLEKKVNNDKFTIGDTNIFNISKISLNDSKPEKVCPICTKRVSSDTSICMICGHKF